MRNNTVEGKRTSAALSQRYISEIIDKKARGEALSIYDLEQAVILESSTNFKDVAEVAIIVANNYSYLNDKVNSNKYYALAARIRAEHNIATIKINTELAHGYLAKNNFEGFHAVIFNNEELIRDSLTCLKEIPANERDFFTQAYLEEINKKPDFFEYRDNPLQYALTDMALSRIYGDNNLAKSSTCKGQAITAFNLEKEKHLKIINDSDRDSEKFQNALTAI